MPIIGVTASSILKASTAFDSIATWSSGNNTSQEISFTSIPQTYKHLQIRAYLECTTEGQSPLLRFNGDSATNYSFHTVRQFNTSTFDTYGSANSSYAINASLWGTYGTEASGFPNLCIIDIFDYANTSKFKTCRALTYGAKVSATLQRHAIISSAWRSNSAITSLSFNALLYTSYTRVSLYGIKG